MIRIQEQGHLRIQNRVYEAVLDAPFTDVQRRIVMLLVRQTLGWGRQTVEISTPEIARALSLEVTGSFRSALSELITAGVLHQVVRGDGKVRSVYRVQTTYEQWGRYAIATARLAAKWGERPKHRDDLLSVSADVGDDESSGAEADESSDEGDSKGSPSLVSGGAQEQAGALEQAPRGARPQAPGVPASRHGGSPPAGTPTGSISRSATSYEPGKTLKDNERQLHNNTNNNAGANGGASEQAGALKQAPPFDVTTLTRWAELATVCETDGQRSRFREFLERQTSIDEARRWISRLLTWLAGEMVPPTWRGKLTPEVLSTALDEYTGTFAVRHVSAFVEDVMRRFSGETAAQRRTSDVTDGVGSRLDTWAADSAAREKKHA